MKRREDKAPCGRVEKDKHLCCRYPSKLHWELKIHRCGFRLCFGWEAYCMRCGYSVFRCNTFLGRWNDWL